jgi:hypothetical protein
MKRTRGENNRLRTEDWKLFEQDVSRVSGCKIIQTHGGYEPSWSFEPGGRGLSFESDSNVIIYLYEKYCLMLFNKPDYYRPGTYQSYFANNPITHQDHER